MSRDDLWVVDAAIVEGRNETRRRVAFSPWDRNVFNWYSFRTPCKYNREICKARTMHSGGTWLAATRARDVRKAAGSTPEGASPSSCGEHVSACSVASCLCVVVVRALVQNTV